MTHQPHTYMAWIKQLLIITVLLSLGGCATSKDELMPNPEGQTMNDLWEQGTQGSSKADIIAARGTLRRPIGPHEMTEQQFSHSRNVENEIYSQFKRLPNPDLVMFIYPHLSGSESVPVPGYSTVFPLYRTPQYAMPGEMQGGRH